MTTLPDNYPTTAPRRYRQALALILVLGALLRVLVTFSADPMSAYQATGGDQLWYLANGYGLFAEEISGRVYGVPYTRDALGNPPLYLIMIGLPQHALSAASAIYVIWGVQCLLSLLIVYGAGEIARHLHSPLAGVIAAGALAFAPVMIYEPRYILTETLYIACVVMGLWLYVRAVPPAIPRLPTLALIGVGVLFGLATLTRAVGMLYPMGLAGLIAWQYGRAHWRRALMAVVLLLGVYGATITTWTLYNVVYHERALIVSNQLLPALWRGAVTDDSTPQANDALLAQSSAGEQVATVVTRDPLGYLRLRLGELGASYLQPHGTIPFGDESLRALAGAWVRDGFSGAGLWRLLNGEGFWIKTLFYIWHGVGLVLGLVGMVLTRGRWRLSLAVIGFIAYTTLLHLIVIAIPRYIFPTFPLYWVFAGVTLAHLLISWRVPLTVSDG